MARFDLLLYTLGKSCVAGGKGEKGGRHRYLSTNKSPQNVWVMALWPFENKGYSYKFKAIIAFKPIC